MAEPRPEAYPESPCVGICHIAEDGYCDGCLRTMAEIARWPLMSMRERAAVFKLLERRAHTFGPA